MGMGSVLPPSVRELSNEDLSKLARKQHLAGKLAVARQLYEELLRRDEDAKTCLTMLATIAYLTGQDALAEGYLERTLDLYREHQAAYPSDSGARLQYGLLQLARGQTDEGESALSQVDLPLAARSGPQGEFITRFEKGIERGLPLMLLTGAPYSGCEGIGEAIANGLEVASGSLSLGLYPRACFIPSRLFVAAQGGFVATETVAPTPYNVGQMAAAGVSRTAVITRDPRAVALSWAQALQIDQSLKIMAPLWRDFFPSAQVLRGGLPAALDWSIATIIPLVCRVLADWKALADEGRSEMAVAFAAVEAGATDPLGEVHRLLEFFGVDEKAFDTERAQLPAPVATGGPPAWQASFTKQQFAEATALIPDDLAEALGWAR
jgi:hypothetical protein